MRLNKVASTIALAGCALAMTGALRAQTSGGAPASAPAMAGKAGASNGADQKFVMEAAKGGATEVALGQLAQQKGGSDAVKQFGSKMVEDHGKANDELKQLATSKNIMLPPPPSKDPKMQKMERLSGNAFDRAYMTAMLDDHKKTIVLFEGESSNGSDADIKAFATKTLPTLKTHLQMVQTNQHGAAASGASMKH